MTHSHGLDFTLCEAVLQRDDFAFLGLIGSRTKRARFERGWRELGLSEQQTARLVCPIGGRLRDKRPAVIAALVAAEILHALAALATSAEHKTTGEAAA
jgi:xanthine dehydrogenase accessory factor/xanthine dehydrogenase large subunit